MSAQLPSRKFGISGFSMHEAGELIRRCGDAKGYEVVSEYPVKVSTRDRMLRIDWVWLRDQEIYAAFEIEGSDVGRSSVANDIEKLTACGAMKRFVVTYDCRFTSGGWKKLRNKSLALDQLRSMRGSGITVVEINKFIHSIY